MPGTKEIRMKIRSVQNTRKITKAMEMVAASKMRKAQERMRHARPYGEKIRNVAAHISHANPEYRHPFLVDRDSVKRVGIIVITTDKGLCGALNTNLLRLVLAQYKEWQEPVIEQLLPLSGERLGAPETVWDYIYEPEARAVLDQVMTRYIEALIYQAVSENMASEQSARMVAMKSASEIVGGAAAV